MGRFEPRLGLIGALPIPPFRRRGLLGSIGDGTPSMSSGNNDLRAGTIRPRNEKQQCGQLAHHARYDLMWSP